MNPTSVFKLILAHNVKFVALFLKIEIISFTQLRHSYQIYHIRGKVLLVSCN